MQEEDKGERDGRQEDESVPLHYKGRALEFQVVGRWGAKARTSKLKLPHFTCDTPMFMPVGTQGTIKGLTSQQLEELDCHIILGALSLSHSSP